MRAALRGAEPDQLGASGALCIDSPQYTIPEGGMALLFSDGLNEAADSSGAEFGFQRITEALFDHREETAEEICETLWQAVKTHSGENLYQDDFTTIAIKRLAIGK